MVIEFAPKYVYAIIGFHMTYLRRLLPITLIATLVLLLGALPAGAQDAEVTPARAGGIDRYSTAAIAMTQVAFPGGTDTAIVATGENFPDALAAAGLAGQANAALLLTESDEVPQTTGVNLIDLGVENIYVLGGEAAVSDDVLETVDGPERDVSRLAGDDRYETAAAVAREVARLGAIDEVNGEPAAFLTTGERYADAVTAGAPAAAGVAAPILLTETDTLPDATAQALTDLDIGHLWVIGGEAAVSADVVTELEGMDIQIQRIAGENRQETATEVARAFVDGTVLDGSVVTLARGDAFPDALTGAVTAAATGGPVLLTHDPNTLTDDTEAYLSDPAAPISVIRAMGGDAAITPDVLARAVEVAEGTTETPAEQSWILAPQEALTPAPDEVADFTLTAQPDGEALPGSLMLALYDCRVVDATGTDRTFNDNENNGLADGFATTEQGVASIAVVNGNDIEDTNVVQDVAPVDGEVTFRLASAGADCAVPVVWEDTSVNGQLDVDDAGQPTEPYNVGQVTWQ